MTRDGLEHVRKTGVFTWPKRPEDVYWKWFNPSRVPVYFEYFIDAGEKIAETFDMEVQPQLLLLQKNMLMAEGVSRALDPALNIWTLAQPLIEAWRTSAAGR